ncbi:BlaI/MecI/CopY family transcriptional regulator [Paenibacillus hodogayensis]|uniref:BlaI/MecI/CopY family transcriptional regulator n=1 Tax=Paenibacillus hodogayensis TaxID=279208 RepID=A0ABV5VSQ6_9BACL
MKLHHFKVNEKGLNRFFGPLEARVMDIVWTDPDISIRDVQASLSPETTVSFNTVMTVLNRLADKELLFKRVEGRQTLYRPVLSREQFMHTRSRELTHELVEEFGPLVVNHMLDALEEADPALIAQLEQKLQSMKKDAPS